MTQVLYSDVEAPFRKALGHAARAEVEELESLLLSLTSEQVAACVSLCTVAAGYTAIDVVGREWPNEENLRIMARETTTSDNAKKLGFSEQEVYDFVTRVSLRFEPINEVFANPEQMLVLPFYITAHLLISFHPADGKWWDFLDKIAAMFEVAEAAELDLTPALMLRARRTRLEEDRRKQQSSQLREQSQSLRGSGL
jgi:hypothetical protein